MYFIRRVEDVEKLEDPVLAPLQHQLLSALAFRRPQCGGGGGVPARNPSVSVSEKLLCNFASY